ncbi:TetR/AcrR family transcriptional regulator [Cupriavidus taiwanensis]|uniref:TetR/AcrR family transcriptional regulator n=1 Tax=Cupriavidus taiwanensis TaxID=164546 RepID=UPI001E595106|nr:helix-turn-helix domain-containing protein [Cupriavidus taiwanensis]
MTGRSKTPTLALLNNRSITGQWCCMGRPRTFDEDVVIACAAEVFGRIGYNACSVDDLVEATALQRGSLYKAFGSKRGLFEKVLDRVLVGEWYRDPAALDLLITALRELAPADLPIAARCRDALHAYGQDAAELLGARLLGHLPPLDPNKE